MRADRRDPVVAEIKKYRPTSLTVHMRTGDPRQVPIPTKANRWELLSETLQKLEWVQIECNDREGSLLGIVQGDEEDEQVVDETEGRDERMARLIIGIVHQVQQETRAQYAEQMGAFVQLASATTSGLRTVTETYNTALKVQAAHIAQQAGGGGDDADMFKVLQMASLLQAKQGLPPPVPQRPPVRRPSPAPAPKKSSSEIAGAVNGTPLTQAS